MGSLAKGFFAESCGNSAEICKEMHFIAPEKGCGNSAESLRKFRGNLRNIFCNNPCPNDPISELLTKCRRLCCLVRDSFRIASLQGRIAGDFDRCLLFWSSLPSWTKKIHAWRIVSRMNKCKTYMWATCRKLFEILFHGSYMCIIPQHVSGHVRDTCMKFLGIDKCKVSMLVTCRKCFRINNVSFSSTMVFSPPALGASLVFRLILGADPLSC